MAKRLARNCVTRRSIAVASLSLLGASSLAHATDLPAPVFKAPPERVATLDSRWSAALATEVRYYSWKSDRGQPSNFTGNPGSGTQVYTPFALQLTGTPNDLFKVELLGRGGWVESRQTTNGLTGEVATFTDTVASGTITYLGINGIQPFVSMNVNLPTGKSALFGTQANARMDPDLVEIGSFGEGLNLGPSVGFNLPVTPSFLVTIAAGYTWRGAFYRENSLVAAPSNPLLVNQQTVTSLNPGDVFTFTASAAYANGPWSASLIGTVSEEAESTEDRLAIYKAGRRYLASATLGYSWPETFGVTTLTASLARSNRNEVKFLGGTDLITEPFNTNSHLYRVGIEHLWPIGRLWLGPTASYLYRNNNSYNADTFQFVPAKTRYSAGALARFGVNENVSFNLRAEHVWTHEDEKQATNGQMFSVLANGFVLTSSVPVVSSTGWQLAGGFNVRF
jgi:hypothetical protein